jgi:hypothetical protein
MVKHIYGQYNSSNIQLLEEEENWVIISEKYDS